MENRENLLSKEKTTKENRIWVRISAACNNKCIFCLDSDAQNGKLIQQDIVKQQIKDGYKQGVFNRIIISGGEASINPKFPEYIAYAKEIGYDRIQTVTNGNMFFHETFCKKVFDAGLQEVTFSFHGHTPQLHDFLVATPGAFKKSLKGLIYVKKFFPNIIVNIDIVVNRVNVPFLPDIVKFFMRLGVYEFDILQIIPFGRGFSEFKQTLFYNIAEYKDTLKKTWELSKIPGVHMWTNRFHVEAFEGYEDLIQDPRKIKSEVMGESIDMFAPFLESKGDKKPVCFGERCEYCFLKQFCHDFLDHGDKQKDIDVSNVQGINDYTSNDFTKILKKYISLQGEEFPSAVYEKFGKTGDEFIEKINSLNLREDQQLVNVPMCIRSKNNNGTFQYYPDIEPLYTIQDYTKKYILGLYRKKSLNCIKCKYNNSCEGIHLNFIRSYGFGILDYKKGNSIFSENEVQKGNDIGKK